MASPPRRRLTPRELMELAIQEAEHSIPEHTDKEDPFVGAIVATKHGEILGKAYRGELRVGEHCEFTLLERKLRDQNLGDCVLYLTLEPCTGESRNELKGKQGCAMHISRARISTVYIGIEYPDPRIANKGTKFLISQNVVVHPFESDLQEKIRQRNSRFILEKEQEAKAIALETRKEEKTLLEKAKDDALVAGLSQEALRKFIAMSQLPYPLLSPDFNNWAIDYGLLEKIDGTGELKPTGLGIMLFGERPSLLYPQVIFKTDVHYNKGEHEIRDFEDPLVFQLPRIIEYVKDKALRLTIDRSHGERIEVPDFPIDVIREVVVNAIIHRDYTIEGATNYLCIDPEKIVVRSPGAVAPPVTLDDLKEFKASWHSRNPKIMYVFNQMKLAEQRGKGISSMKQLPTLGFPLPTFDMEAGSLVVTFARTKAAFGREKLTEQEYSELLFIQGNEPVTRAQFAKQFRIPDRTAKDHLVKLVEMGRIKPVGRGKATKYVSVKG